MNALDHPIILSAEGWVMDGMHRICKALLPGHESIQAIRFSPTPEPDETFQPRMDANKRQLQKVFIRARPRYPRFPF